jgi:hypothetical protein
VRACIVTEEYQEKPKEKTKGNGNRIQLGLDKTSSGGFPPPYPLEPGAKTGGFVEGCRTYLPAKTLHCVVCFFGGWAGDRERKRKRGTRC